MNYETLLSKFNQALIWNAILFFMSRTSKTLITFILFTHLSQHDFATWANITSLVFIINLWCDFGLRRSLPRYMPEFSRNNAFKKKFLFRLLAGYTAFLLIANILFIRYASCLANLLHLSGNLSFFFIGCGLLFVESIKSVLRLIFYAHFQHKRFNLVETGTVSISTACILISGFLFTQSNYLLTMVFALEIGTSILLIIIALWFLHFVYDDPDYQGEEPIDSTQLTKDFVTHSGAMWFILVAQSITERNVLVPFFTITMGHPIANTFKVANDAALLLQRFVLRVIGTAGTSLFAHVEAHLVTKASLPSTFELFNKRLCLLIAPLFGIIMVITFAGYGKADSFMIFPILSVCYLVQMLFMGYSKLLEVKRDYGILFISLIPYLGVLLFFGLSIHYSNLPTSLGLMSILGGMQVLRLISTGIQVVAAQHRYKTSFPLRYFLKIAAGSLLCGLLLRPLFPFFGK